MATQNTKYNLAQALKELMKVSSLEKITILDIANKCGVTRQTFYRNFEDKYALVNWYFETLVHQSFIEMNEKKDLKFALESKFKFIESELVFFKCAFKIESYDSLIEYDYRYILNFYTEIIYKKTGCELSDEVKFALELYCKGSIFQTIQWVNNDKRPSAEFMADALVNSLPIVLKDLLLSFV